MSKDPDTTDKKMMVDPSVAAGHDAQLVRIFALTVDKVEAMLEADDLNASGLSVITRFLESNAISLESIRARAFVPAGALDGAGPVPAIGYDGNSVEDKARQAKTMKDMGELAVKLGLHRFADDKQATDET